MAANKYLALKIISAHSVYGGGRLGTKVPDSRELARQTICPDSRLK